MFDQIIWKKMISYRKKIGAQNQIFKNSSYYATLLIRAIHLGNYAVVEELLKGGATSSINRTVYNTDGFSTDRWRGDSYWRPLHVAAALGRKDIAKLLLSYGADKNLTTTMLTRDGKSNSLDAYDVASQSEEYGTLSAIQDY